MAVIWYGTYKCPHCGAKGSLTNTTKDCHACAEPVSIEDLVTDAFFDVSHGDDVPLSADAATFWKRRRARKEAEADLAGKEQP